MYKRFKTFPIIIAMVVSVAVSGCKTTGSTTKEETVKEIMPGLLQGYLSKEEMPNSLALIPPPPEEGSVAFALDQEYAKKAVESSDTARFGLATSDAHLGFPAAVKSFESTVGIEISETKTPKLYMLMRRVLTDAGLSTYTAKMQYKRKRPFMINNTPTCTPADEVALRKDGSYPSGHTAIGWAWALVFSEIFPGKTNAILQRGYAFGESRVICNVHWHSDVEMGRVIGAATVASLHANPTFQRDLAAAKEEVKKVLPVK
ncbi:MAG TPA: phosphatase PAP2 family protein [Chryseolinea sp.]|nr:phosphatase PAP2 family protein [Chryseolinea sp.]